MWRYREILQEQLYIAEHTTGAFPVDVTDNMPIGDREYIFHMVYDRESAKQRQMEQVRAAQAARRKTNRNHSKSAPRPRRK